MDHLLVLFLAEFLCCAGAWKPPEAPRRAAPGRRALSRTETPSLPSPYLHLPVFVDSRLPLVPREYFSPAAGTGLEPLPQEVREILIPAVPNTRPPNVSGTLVKIVCEPEKIIVQVPRSILGDGGGGDVSAQVKVGPCRANESTAEHLIFEFDLNLCGTEQTVSRRQPAGSHWG